MDDFMKLMMLSGNLNHITEPDLFSNKTQKTSPNSFPSEPPKPLRKESHRDNMPNSSYLLRSNVKGPVYSSEKMSPSGLLRPYVKGHGYLCEEKPSSPAEILSDMSKLIAKSEQNLIDFDNELSGSLFQNSPYRERQRQKLKAKIEELKEIKAEMEQEFRKVGLL